MLTSWFTVAALLVASASPAATDRGPLTVAATCRVRGHPEVELTLNCGHGENTGVVQYWHTPFGELRAPGLHSELAPVFMHHDGSLVVPRSSSLHGGLYYCLLQHTEGTTLWPYELHVGSYQQENQEQENQEQENQEQENQEQENQEQENQEQENQEQENQEQENQEQENQEQENQEQENQEQENQEQENQEQENQEQENQEQENQEQDSSCRRLRIRRNSASVEEEKPAGVSDGEFAGAVAASVLLTFVLGFSAGALTRAQVLRCLGAITAKVRSLRQPDVPDRDSEVSMTTLPSMYDNEAFGIGQVWDGVTMETTTASSPPVKPQRSFRLKREEQQETAVYLEGCDNTEEEKRGIEGEGEEGRSLEEKKEGKEEEEEEREVTGFYLLGDNGGSQSETDEDKYSDDGEEDGRREDEERKGSEQEAEGSREEERDETEGDDGEMDKDTQQSETEEEMDRKTSADTQGIMGGEEASSSPPRSARRSRIIRLYQYDEEGQRYCHLPDPAPDEPVPAPRLKQRSLSLTRLNAIMAAASAGPLDGRETRGEAGEKTHFHMEI